MNILLNKVFLIVEELNVSNAICGQETMGGGEFFLSCCIVYIRIFTGIYIYIEVWQGIHRKNLL